MRQSLRCPAELSLRGVFCLPVNEVSSCFVVALMLALVLQRRRERVNARLRALQGLVPGAASMTTESFLLEAVHYIRFLMDELKVGNALPLLFLCSSPAC